MNESEHYVADAIRTWIWSGFYGEDELPSMLEDLLDDSLDRDSLLEFVASEWRRKVEAEKSWPEETDCDRLDAVFQDLNAARIVALQNAGYTISDGHSDVGEVLQGRPRGYYKGYCLYHGQDVERAAKGEGLLLAYADLQDTEAGKKAIGKIVCDVLKAHGFKPAWDGSTDQRITVPDIVWRRRFSP